VVIFIEREVGDQVQCRPPEVDRNNVIDIQEVSKTQIVFRQLFIINPTAVFQAFLPKLRCASLSRQK